MAGAVENKKVARDSLGCNDVGVLLHVSRSVDFSFVVDPLSNTDLAFGASKTANL